MAVGALLTHLFTGDAKSSAAAGLVLAISPTGIGLTGLVMADLLLGVVFAVGFLLLVASARYRRSGWLHAAGLLFGLGALVKPVMFVWAPCGLLVAWLVAGGRTTFVPLRSLALFVALQVLPGTLWAACNYARDGVFTVSSIGPRTARFYLASKVLAWRDAGHRPDEEAVRAYQRRARTEIKTFATHKERLRWANATTLQALRAAPGIAVRAYLDDLEGNTGGAWSYFPRQLVSYPRLHPPLETAARLEAGVRRLGRWLLLAALAAAIAGEALTRERRRRQFALDLCALAVPIVFFVVLSGITFWTGPRIVYPASVCAVALGAVALRRAAVSAHGRCSRR